MRKYKYIFFDSGSLIKGAVDTSDYYYVCTLDLRKDDGINVISYPTEGHSLLYHKLFVSFLFLSKKFPSLSFLSRLFYSGYIPKQFRNEDKLCIVVYGYYITPDYLRYVRDKYPNAKIVKIHRDSYDIWRRKNHYFTDKDMNELFDLQLSYDFGDSEKYNMIHFDEIESKIDITLSNDYPIHDVFFAGAAKDRLPFLIKIYDYLEANGIKPFFYITNVDKHDQIERTGITYSSNNMRYVDMLYNTINSKVVLEVNQGCVDGFTSRFLESVLYNKKLLTNNVAIKKNGYYNSDFIQIFSNPEDIDISFIQKQVDVDYKYNNEFSPIHLIDLIDKSLVEKYGE